MKISLQKPLALLLIIPTFLSILFFGPPVVNAADSDDSLNTFVATTTNAECSKYYNINSVSIDIKPRMIHSITGTTMPFSGYVLNNNKYPIVNGKLYAKVLRNRSKNDGNGPDVLDTFVIKEGINLKAGEKLPISFEWNIPAFAIGGDYKMATYFISNNRFNLAGLSFTDTAPGGVTSFTVKSQQNTEVFFKKDEVRINNKLYSFSNPPSSLSATSTVNISVPISNTTKERQAIKVEFNVYRLDAQSTENKLDTFNQMVVLEAGKSMVLPFSVKDNQSSVYYVEAILKYRDNKSILGIRFARSKIDMPRINFISPVSYPFVSGEKNTIFACFNNISTNNIPLDGKLNIEILNNNNSPIFYYEYTGKITANTQAVSQEFITRSSYRDFKVHATLSSGDRVVDEVYLNYSCDQIDPENCGAFNLSSLTSNKWLMMTLYVLGGIILLILIVLLVMRSKKMKMYLANKREGVINSLILLIMLMSVLSIHQTSYAATSTDSGVGPGGCFTVTSLDPATAPARVSKLPIDKATVNVLGTDLNQVRFVRFATVQATIKSQTPTNIVLEIERLMSTDPNFLTFYNDPFFASCTTAKTFSFVCNKPKTDAVVPNSGPTTGGTTVTIFGENLRDVSSVRIGHVTIKDVVPNIDGTELTFVTTAQTEGWKNVSVKNPCGITHELIPAANAFQFVKGEKKKEPPIPPFIEWDQPKTNTVDSPTVVNDPEYLYYWSGHTENSAGYNPSASAVGWSSALKDSSATLNYESRVTDETGLVLQDGDNIPLGKKINFDFVGASSSIVWKGNPLVQNTTTLNNPLGLSVGTGIFNDGASYPSTSAICTTNPVSTKDYSGDSESPDSGDADIYIPLAIDSPAKFVAFNDGTLLGGIDSKNFLNWKTLPVPSNDTASWSCNSEMTSCYPVTVGVKYLYMYRAPTYGNYYYGWKKTTDNICRTNNIPLNEKIRMTVNNQPAWAPIDGTGGLSWQSITSSTNGSKLAAVVYNGYIYTSTTSGSTWTASTDSAKNWQSITSSSDGVKLAAVVNNGYVYTSTDSGVIWTERTDSGIKSWKSITSSSDGTKLAAAVYGGYIYTSTDSGATWTASTDSGIKFWKSITSSSDGTKLAAVAYNDYVYVSTDSGNTWGQKTYGKSPWSSIASDSTGSKLVAVLNDTYTGYIYVSTTSGATWALSKGDESRKWSSVASSIDGSMLVAGVENGSIWTSTDGGENWIEETGTNDSTHLWKAVTSSSDGSKIVAVDGSNGSIWNSTINSVVNEPVSTCELGSTGCSSLAFLGNTQGDLIGCPINYDFYNFDTSKCYKTFDDYLSSYHLDLNFSDANVPMDYYRPYQLNFRESYYNLNLNVVASSTNVPSSPVITEVIKPVVGVEGVYSAKSTLSVAKNKSDSFFASVFHIFKKVFADEEEDAVGYRFDWNYNDNDGVDESLSPYSYGQEATSSHTWSVAGSTTIAVQAFDVKSGLSSDWVTLVIEVGAAVENIYDVPANFRLSYCTQGTSKQDYKLEWNPVDNATSYSLNDTITIAVPTTSYQIGSYNDTDLYNIRACGPKTTDPANEEIKCSARNSLDYTNNINRGDCSAVVDPKIIIKDGITFKPIKPWADITGKCSFSGEIEGIIVTTDGISDKTYNGVLIDSCSIDSKPLDVPNPPVSTFTFSNIKAGVGLHTLRCTVTASTTNESGEEERVTATPYMESKCSKVPDVIEK